MIAHRLSTILKADKIFVMKQGMIVESGNHESLLKRSGYYKELYTKQISPREEELKLASGFI